jgi:hypothetical protein
MAIDKKGVLLERYMNLTRKESKPHIYAAACNKNQCAELQRSTLT